jgi:hypothetical protein
LASSSGSVVSRSVSRGGDGTFLPAFLIATCLVRLCGGLAVDAPFRFLCWICVGASTSSRLTISISFRSFDDLVTRPDEGGSCVARVIDMVVDFEMGRVGRGFGWGSGWDTNISIVLLLAVFM